MTLDDSKFTHEQRSARRAEAIAAARSGVSFEELRSRFPFCPGYLRQMCGEAGVAIRGARDAGRERKRQMIAAVAAGKSRAEAAAEFGFGRAYVNALCSGAGLRIPPGRKPGSINEGSTIVSHARWAAADWSQGDAVLARVLGVTRERVRQVRQQLKKDKPPRVMSGETIRLRRWLSENLEQLRGLSVADIRSLCPAHVGAETIRAACKLAGMTIPVRGAGNRITRENLQSFCSSNDRGCWEWAGVCNPVTGYARIGKASGHHFSFRLFKGEIPPGLWILHTCDNPACVNPDHLYAGTPLDNAKDRDDRYPHPRGKRLDHDKAAEIRAMWASGGHPLNVIGKRFGVSATTVYQIVRNRTWKQPESEQAVAS